MQEVWISVISLVGTVAGSFFGVVASQKLTTYRLQQLEKKVDKHNRVVERMVVIEEKMKVANHRIEDLEHKCI